MSADISLDAPGCCEYHSHNVTHNLAPMFREAGVDWHDYRDEKRTGAELGREVVNALERLIYEPEKFRAMNPPNGWGSYEGAVAFLSRLALDCAKHPDAIVGVSL